MYVLSETGWVVGGAARAWTVAMARPLARRANGHGHRAQGCPVLPGRETMASMGVEARKW